MSPNRYRDAGGRHSPPERDYHYRETVTPLPKKTTIGLSFEPNEELQEALALFMNERAIHRLGSRALTLTSQRQLQVVDYERSQVKREIAEYRHRLADAPNITDAHFALRREFAARIDRMHDQYTVALKLGVAAVHQARIFSEPLFDPEEAASSLVVGHHFPLSEVQEVDRLEWAEKDFRQALEAKHPSATDTMAPFYFTAGHLRVTERRQR